MIDMSKSTFVPNAFQTPNGYVDAVMMYLTGEEYKVLIYATRRILGFQKRQDRIALSQFTDGTKNKDGDALDKGTGLSVGTVKNCLRSLASFNLMVKLDDNDPKTNEGNLWALQWDADKVNWEALEERHKKKQETGRKRMTKARSVRQTHPKPPTPGSGTERTPGSPTTPPPTSGTETQKTVEKQRKTVNPSLEFFTGYFGKFKSEKEVKRWIALFEAVGKDKADQLAAWAFKKEIHLTNRGGLLDSLETAAKNWHDKPATQPEKLDRPEYHKFTPKEGNYVPNPFRRPRVATN